MIGIVDYGMGNLRSVYNAFDMLGVDAKICSHPDELTNAERIVLPGVGAFRDCMVNLAAKGFREALHEVRRQGKPILGICLGMQAMARRSFEGGEHEGLNWFEGDVIRLQAGDASLRVPQIGWNEVRYQPDSPLFAGLPANPHFYFVHSYFLKCARESEVVAACDYGGSVTAAVCKENIFATQFHPEKSQAYGLRVLQNFLVWNP
jgi:imidazole glycerol-phosphate synthase subunit HisH